MSFTSAGFNHPAVRRGPTAPLLAIDGAKVAILIGPFIPDRNAVLLQIRDVRIAFQEPEQFDDD